MQEVEGNGTVSARIARGLTIDATFLATRLSEVPILANHIWHVKTTYQLTRELGVRVILQRDTLRTDSDETPLPPYSNLTGDVLLTYMVAPGRAVFLGVARYEHQRAPRPPGHAWQPFAKMSYAFQM